MLLSTEEFCRADGNLDVIRFIRDKFAGINVKIIAYRRDPVDFLLSLYHHLIRQGDYAESFQDYIAKDIDPRVAEFDRRISGWKTVFGAENVLMRDYDALTKGPQKKDIVVDMFEAMGRSSPQVEPKSKRVNLGVHPWLRNAYCELKKSDLPEEQRSKLKNNLVQIGKDFPRINAAEYYLGPEKYLELKNRFNS